MRILKEKKSLVIVCVLISIIAGLFYLEYRPKQSVKSDSLVVGILSGYEPYARINDQGNFEGFDIDVAKTIAQKLGKKLVFKDMSLAALLIALQQNKIDLLISGLSITPERQEKMNMVYYQGTPTTSYPLVCWKEIPQDIKTIEDLKNYPDKTIVVEPGSSQEAFLMQFNFLKLKQLSSMAEIVMDLKYGKSLAALMDPDIVPTSKKQNPELVSIDIALPKQYQSQGCGIGINKDNGQLTQQVTKIIAQLKAEGVLEQLERTWFKEEQ